MAHRTGESRKQYGLFVLTKAGKDMLGRDNEVRIETLLSTIIALWHCMEHLNTNFNPEFSSLLWRRVAAHGMAVGSRL